MASGPKPSRCPECREPATEQFRPFCSKRCADIDLARWLTGGYAIPAAAVTDDAEDDSPGTPGSAN
jgi:uncharacterized protein